MTRELRRRVRALENRPMAANSPLWELTDAEVHELIGLHLDHLYGAGVQPALQPRYEELRRRTPDPARPYAQLSDEELKARIAPLVERYRAGQL